MLHTSVIEISRLALQNNLQFIKGYLNPDVKLSCVVKGNAYGHGLETYIPLAEASGVDHFSVFSTDEAFRVKQVCNENTTVLIMGYVDNEDVEWAINEGVEFYIFEMDRLNVALKMAEKSGIKARVHLEVETGMNRTGFDAKSFKQALTLLKKFLESFSFEGVCTHFAGAESIANYVRVHNQIKKFNQFKKILEKEGLRPRRYHTACSAAAIAYPKTQMDMVRIGILQYGYWPTQETFIHFIHKNGQPRQPLQRILTWKTKVLNVKAIKTGEFIGYGTTYLAQHDKKIATIPLGYSHGFPRSLSNVGRVLVGGKRVGVIGIVNMNILTVDVTSVDGVEKGDEVVVIGRQGELETTVASFSELSAQVNYETLARLPMNIPRVVVD